MFFSTLQQVPWAPSLGIKPPKREVDHSPRSSAEVKNAGAIHPLYNTSSLRGT
jgi:hypothetical protein